MGVKTPTDWAVLVTTVVVGSIGGYIYYVNEINSEGKPDNESVTKTIKSIYQDFTDKITFAGGSATKRHKKYRGGKKSCKQR